MASSVDVVINGDPSSKRATCEGVAGRLKPDKRIGPGVRGSIKGMKTRSEVER